MLNHERNIREERNDCTVRAISQAFDIPYMDAHVLCKAYGRQDGQGFFINARLLSHIAELGKIEILPELIGKRFGALSLLHNETYLVLVTGHMFCVKEGKSLDGMDNSRKRVERIFRVKR